MRLHVVGMPHTQLTREYGWCAFTQKSRKFATMMQSLDDVEVTTYWGEQTEADASEHVVIMPDDKYQEWFGGRDWAAQAYNDFDNSAPPWVELNRNAIRELAKRIHPGDIVCLSMGLAHKPIYDALHSTGAFFVEHAIGYPGVFAPYRIYESHAWRHHIAGQFVGRGSKNWLGQHEDDTVQFFTTVLPNYFEVDAFPEGDGSGGYFLFVGRLTERKGIHIAAITCATIGAKLIVAGQGDFESFQLPGNVEYVGLVNEQERCELMMGTVAQFAPSTYLEPFCAASVEPQMCGTPVISTDWGAMIENIDHGVSGFRCNTLQEFVTAAELVERLDRPSIRKRAQDRWSTDVLKWDHLRYFQRLQTLKGDGWYALDACASDTSGLESVQRQDA